MVFKSLVLVFVIVGALVEVGTTVLAEEGVVNGGTEPSRKTKEFGLFVVKNFANMGGNADQWGTDTASRISEETGGEWSSEKSSVAGLGVGIFGWNSISPSFMFGGLIQYIPRGVEYTFTEGSSGNITKIPFKFNYLEMAILGKVRPPSSWVIIPHFVFGPIFGYRMSGDIPLEFTNKQNET